MLSNYFRKKKKSKKGFTLVEALCSVMILALVFAGVLNSIAFSRQMVFTNNVRDKASDKAQLVADELISICTNKDPDDPDINVNVMPAIRNEIADTINNANDPQYASVGDVTLVDGLLDVNDYTEADPPIQVTIEPVHENLADVTVAGIETKETTQAGWNMTLRIYYRAIGGNDSWQATDVSAFAPYNTVD